MRVNYDVIISDILDFQIDEMIFEVGGKNKGQKQLQGVEKGFVVKDGIEFGYANVVPLWQLGMSD